MSPSFPAPTPAGHLPGRLVDIVHAAVRALGLVAFSITLNFSDGAPAKLWLQLSGDTTEATARAVFAALGVLDPVLGEPYGDRHQLANLDGPVPALDLTQLSVLVTDMPKRPTAGDVAALVADVDARRALADAAAVTA